ncbi:MAG: CoA pyrophosphatase [Deltaproteobacteria bacterium]|nr:MAG: CoA pyrophosphatase [Deltaproteobacteria bacterium]
MTVRAVEKLRDLLIPPEVPPPSTPEGMRQASVLIPLMEKEGRVHVVLSRRTEKVPHHKGQVCFPGGSVEGRDSNALETALREAEEEFSLSREDVTVLGRLDPVPTMTRFYITPYVGSVPPSYEFRPDPFEVAEIFTAPLSYFFDFSRYRTTETFFRGNPYPVYFIDYEGRLIWGATAKILRRFAELLTSFGMTSSF